MVDTYKILDDVRAMVDNSGLTLAEIAHRCGESEQRIRRVLDGKNPSFVPLCGIVMACGGSVDALLGIATPKVEQLPANRGLEIQLRADLRKVEVSNRKKDIAITLLVSAIIILLFMDILNPQFGWIRYEIARDTAYRLEDAAYYVLCGVINWVRQIKRKPHKAL